MLPTNFVRRGPLTIRLLHVPRRQIFAFATVQVLKAITCIHVPRGRKGRRPNCREVPMKSRTYEACRYFTPSSLLASQTTKTVAKVRKRTLKSEPLTYTELLSDQAREVTLVLRPSKFRTNHPPCIPVSFRAIGKTLPDVVWDASAKERAGTPLISWEVNKTTTMPKGPAHEQNSSERDHA